MWLRSPSDPSIADELSEETQYGEIERRKNAGWVELPPLLIKNAAGATHLVTHPAHQARLLAEGGQRVSGKDGPPLAYTPSVARHLTPQEAIEKDGLGGEFIDNMNRQRVVSKSPVDRTAAAERAERAEEKAERSDRQEEKSNRNEKVTETSPAAVEKK